MILTDYFTSEPNICRDYALQCGVTHGVIRLPETGGFDITDPAHWQSVYKSFTASGITPLIIEPMPNVLHDHIKAGDALRDASIEKVIKMFPIMESLNIRTICFNFMAHIGWLRTSKKITERGGAFVTGFDINDFVPTGASISEEELWDNYTYFIKAVIPHAEKHGIVLALHPDDPPLARLGNVSRIMISADNIEKAVNIADSPSLGITMCQATYAMMGEGRVEVIPRFADKIQFIHFRNAKGTKEHFRETFHDNGQLDMAELIRLYKANNIDVPIRVDHVPTMAGEDVKNAGYDALGRLFAIGYLKGLLDAIDR